MPNVPIVGLPGVQSNGQAVHRVVFLTGPERLPGGRILAGSKSRDPLNTGDADVLRPGLLLGRITTGGKYAPAVLGVTTAALTAAGTTLSVSAATAAEVARRLGPTGTLNLTGPASAAGTVRTVTATYSAVNTTTGAITITALGGSNDFVVGSLVQPVDGSQVIRTLLPDGAGIKVTDASGADRDVPLPEVAIGGLVRAAQILNWPADSALQASVKSSLRAVGQFSFDVDF